MLCVDVVVHDVFEALPAILCAISKLLTVMITSISTVLSPQIPKHSSARSVIVLHRGAQPPTAHLADYSA